MTVHEISNYFNQCPNMENAYKEHKNIGRLIRSKVFKCSRNRYYNEMDITYKITYIKTNCNGNLVVNIKVSGTMGGRSSWRSDEKICVTDYVRINHSTSRSRNNDIRREVLNDVQNFFRLFGVEGYRIEIGKVKVCKEL